MAWLLLFPVVVFLFRSDLLINAIRCSKFNQPDVNNNIHLNNTTGILKSPDYTSQARYPSDMTCTWIITGPVGRIIRLEFTVFDLEESSGTCANKDFLRVRNGFQVTSPLLGEYCGAKEAFAVATSGRSMWVHFRSDSSIGGKGFSASYRAIVPNKTDEKDEVSVALIVVGSIIGVLVTSGVVLVICSKKKLAKTAHSRRGDRAKRHTMGSRLSMYNSRTISPSAVSLRSNRGRHSRSGSPVTTLDKSGRHLKHQLSVPPKVFLTNEFGVSTNLLGESKVSTEVQVHISPFSKRRLYGNRALRSNIKSLSSVGPASPTLPRRHFGNTSKLARSTGSLETPLSKLGSPPVTRSLERINSNNNTTNLT